MKNARHGTCSRATPCLVEDHTNPGGEDLNPPLTTGREIRFEVAGEPCPKGRARAYARGGRAVMVTPEKTRTNEREFLALAAHALPSSPLSGPLRVRLAFFVSRAKTKPKWWQVAALANPPRVWPRGRDVDNLAKQVLDCCNGRFFVDDRQVVSLWATKEYSDRPRTVVVIEELYESRSAKEDRNEGKHEADRVTGTDRQDVESEGAGSAGGVREAYSKD